MNGVDAALQTLLHPALGWTLQGLADPSLQAVCGIISLESLGCEICKNEASWREGGCEFWSVVTLWSTPIR